ncbi:MAG: DUF2141 domain-containing protein [Saprospiraceae bacterium]|nr:DUF2141 domain-containing protein [Saprospiraceae bacterium]
MNLRLFFPAFIIFLIPFSGNSQATLKVSVHAINEPKGELFIGLYNSESTFKNTDSVYMDQIIPIDSSIMVTYFEELPQGSYALTMFQDKNSNGKMDKGIFGQPKEKYGFSNNPKIMFKSPGFEKCMFKVTERDTTVYIKMK